MPTPCSCSWFPHHHQAWLTTLPDKSSKEGQFRIVCNHNAMAEDCAVHKATADMCRWNVRASWPLSLSTCSFLQELWTSGLHVLCRWSGWTARIHFSCCTLQGPQASPRVFCIQQVSMVVIDAIHDCLLIAWHAARQGHAAPERWTRAPHNRSTQPDASACLGVVVAMWGLHSMQPGQGCRRTPVSTADSMQQVQPPLSGSDT